MLSNLSKKIIPPKLVYSYFKYDIILRIHTRIYLNQLLKKFESCASHFLNFRKGKLYSPKMETIFRIDILINFFNFMSAIWNYNPSTRKINTICYNKSISSIKNFTPLQSICLAKANDGKITSNDLKIV